MTQALSLILWFVTHVMWQNAPCLPGGIEFIRQGQVDSFNIRNPGCDQVIGNLVISGNNITNLDSLRSIKSIGGYLYIYGTTQLKNLNGLSGLQSINSYIQISSNKRLSSLSGLQNLTYLAEAFYFSSNDSLTDISALNIPNSEFLSNVTIINCPRLALCNTTFLCRHLAAGGLGFFENNAPGCNDRFQIMKSCNPTDPCPSGLVNIHRQSDVTAFAHNFPNCTQLPGSLYIGKNGDTITNLSGLPKIKTIGGSLTINDNSFLTGLQGLDSLRSVGNEMFIGYNRRIKTLAGLGALSFIESRFVIFYNDSLTSLAGLDDLDGTSTSTLHIYENPRLSTCATGYVCSYLTNNENASYSDIRGNAIGCSSLLDIQRICFPGACPPGDLVFHSQYEVNQFPSWFPGCNVVHGSLLIDNSSIKNLDSLYQITDVEGELYLYNNDSLQSIRGLSHLTSIGGDLEINDNKLLKSLQGLESLQHVFSGVILNDNDSLNDISALNQLELKQTNYLEITYNSSLSTCSEPFVCNYISQGYNLDCYGNANGCSSILQVVHACNPNALCPPGNISLLSQEDVNYFGLYFPDCKDLPGSLYLESSFDSITSLAPLSGLRTIGGGLGLSFHPALTSFQGLDSLRRIDSDLRIYQCSNLKNLVGLGALQSAHGGIYIEDNDSLETLQGIGNISPDSISFLELDQNPRLAVCSVESICNYIERAKPTHIEGNAQGCNSGLQITKECNPGLDCPAGGISLATQAEVDEFYEVYPLCTAIGGNLRITGGNESSPIENLQGLRRIKSVQGELNIDYNNKLKHLYGLDSLQSISGRLGVFSNDSLVDLNGLNSMPALPGGLEIGNNPQFLSLAGLEQVDGTSMGAVNIYNNPLLTYCASPPICAFLNNPNANFRSQNNGSGCSSVSEVRFACGIFSCLPDGVSLSSQADVDAFPANNPGCDRIQGDLFISGADITNLDSLIQLKYLLGGLFIISNPLLTNLNGLSNVISSYYVDIETNNSLSDMSGLSQLTDVQELYILFNPVLSNLSGLQNIDPSGLEIVDIEANLNLRVCEIQSICDLLETDYDPGSVFIQDNAIGCNTIPQVRTACGNAACPPGDLIISTQAEADQYPQTYKDCTILPGNLIIQGEGITSLDSLHTITSINGELRIIGTSLKSLQGIGFINPASITHLVIENNDSLSICEVRMVCDYLSIGSNTYSIFGNAPACAGLSAIMLECAKTCFWDGLTLTTQAQVDAFPVNYGACHIIPGFLTISGSGITRLDSLYNLDIVGGIAITASIANLHGLEKLKTLNSSLNLRNCPNLTDISQLQNLDTIGGNLRVDNCPLLTNLIGLEKIRNVPFTVTITNNAKLSSLQALSSLQRVDVAFTISINPLLSDLNGLGALVSIGNQLLIQNNATLKTLTGLSALKSTGGSCRIENNAMLDSLVGLSALETVGSTMTIRNNPLIKNIKSLSALTKANALTITGNPMLNSLSGVDHLDPVRLNGLTITGSPLLSVCNYRNICNYLNNTSKSATINNNAAGCASRTQILNSCASILPVSLVAFKAEQAGKSILVHWKSTFESNLEHYEIEHRKGGSEFNSIGKQNAAGGASGLWTYQYLHTTPVSGQNYYRLKLMDQNGDFSYSDVVSVNVFDDLKIYPNPTQNKVFVNGWQGTTAGVTVKDMMGRILFESKINPGDPVDLSRQPGGIYILTINTGRQESVFRVLKN